LFKSKYRGYSVMTKNLISLPDEASQAFTSIPVMFDKPI
jgi:hypothetical protein